MARFMNQFAICNVAIPLPGDVPAEVYAQPAAEELHRRPRLDQAAVARHHAVGPVRRRDVPAPRPSRRHRPAADARRSAGLPRRRRLEQARAALVDALLERPEYADHWANKWADLLRPNPYRVGIKAVVQLRRLDSRQLPPEQALRPVRPRAGHGPGQHAGTTARPSLFRDRREPDEITTMVSQLFLGVRLECAKCHHHPFEIWGQDDFYSFAAYFARVGRKGTGISPPISGGEETVLVRKTRRGRASADRQVARAAAAVRRRAAGRRRRRSARGAGRLDHVAERTRTSPR